MCQCQCSRLAILASTDKGADIAKGRRLLQLVEDNFPSAILVATIWAYWFSVGVMVVRARKQTRARQGLVPKQRVERVMWVVWVPLVLAWMLLPWFSLTRSTAGLGLPDFARSVPAYIALRWIAAACAVVCLGLTAQCWARMGKDWSMAIVERPGELITDGLFAHVRHPIYALSIMLMVCSVVIVPTLPMLFIALVHIVLMNLKARNEERHLLSVHGDGYKTYLARTGRFFPGIGGRNR
jgi:protein-S-isoprenylcysteine O-methyltransferase Ste14